VMSGVNPQGCQVSSFKQPSAMDLNHDFLWRYVKRLPERGGIGIFNRSYYEEVLVVRVHEEILRKQRLPPGLVGKRIWNERLADIARFEDYLARQGTIVLKFFLHLSRDEQKKRFLARLDRPEKHWKFSSADVRERQYWDDYMKAYEEAIRTTATKHAPWFVVPADNKWFTRLVVASAIVEAVEMLDLEFPAVDTARKKELAAARAALAREPSRRGRAPPLGAPARLGGVGGLRLFLLGIHHLTEGLKSLAGDSLRRALQTLVSGRFSAVVSGVLFTVAIQSSTATILTVIGFVSAGLVTFSQAIAITIGATLGTTS